MRHVFEEIVLRFTPEQREAWNSGDKSLIPAFHEVHPMILNQPTYHFGEFFTMNHFHRTAGWLGYRFYVLAYLDDFKNPRYAKGGHQIRKTFAPDRLRALIDARGKGRTDGGDPDVFLYKPTGEAMFLEVKVGKDRIDKLGAQLQSLAQIRTFLGCRAEVVHLIPEGERYTPRKYWVEMAPKGLVPLDHGWDA